MLVNIKNDFEFCMKLLSEESVLLIPGAYRFSMGIFHYLTFVLFIYNFLKLFVGVALGADNWVRISIGTGASVLDEIFDRIKTFCDRHAIRNLPNSIGLLQ